MSQIWYPMSPHPTESAIPQKIAIAISHPDLGNQSIDRCEKNIGLAIYPQRFAPQRILAMQLPARYTLCTNEYWDSAIVYFSPTHKNLGFGYDNKRRDR